MHIHAKFEMGADGDCNSFWFIAKSTFCMAGIVQIEFRGELIERFDFVFHISDCTTVLGMTDGTLYL